MRTMTAREMAELLNGREYGSEITDDEELIAKNSGLCVVFGASDDLVEFRGVFCDEVGSYNGSETPIDPKQGPIASHECDCDYCGYKAAIKSCHTLYADWCKVDEYSWTFRLGIPHETFDITEDGETYCRGIVFKVSDLAKDIA